MDKKLDKIPSKIHLSKKKVIKNNLSSLVKLGVKGGPKDLSKNFDKYFAKSIYNKN